jgi:hypothetical protein
MIKPKQTKKPAPKKRTVKSDPKEIDFLVGVNAKNPKGRPRNFKDPGEIWKLFEEYKIYCSENPRFTFTASLGKIVKVPHFKPLTIEGFETFCYSKSLTISHYFENREGRYSEFCDIVTRIKREIRGDQLEGAFVGQYSSNIVARINGISEKTENINRNIEVPLFPDVQEDNSNK